MAKFDITGINFMTSGEKRGMISLRLKSNDRISKQIYLLNRTFEDGEELSVDEKGLSTGCGIITESGKYEYARTDYICNYKDNNDLSALAISNDSEYLILNEQQTYISTETLSGSTNYNDDTPLSSLSVNSPYAIQLNLNAEDDDVSIEEYEKWNEKQKNIRRDFIFETVTDEQQKNMVKFDGQEIMPMYDIQDVMFKSKRRKYVINGNVPKNIGQSKSESSQNETQDIYYDFSKNPISYCQFADSKDTYSVILTNPTTKTPYYLKAGFQEEQTNQNYTYSLSSGDIYTYLCKFAKEYGYENYRDYLSSLGEVDEMTMMSVFQQFHRIDGIKYNYALEMSQCGDGKRDSVLNYEDGNMPFEDMFIMKNSYNPLYSVQMSGESSIDNCRQYCEVQHSDRRLVLKYYDNVRYSLSEGKTAADGTKEHDAICHDKVDEKYPYQKVEYLYKTSTNKTTSHKSNLFSIKINKTGMSEENDKSETKQFTEKIRNDIRNNIREFVNNVCPANTQLFDVYFVES